MRSRLLLAAAFATTIASGYRAHSRDLDLSQVILQGMTASGTGCPQGSVAVYMSNDRQE